MRQHLGRLGQRRLHRAHRHPQGRHLAATLGNVSVRLFPNSPARRANPVFSFDFPGVVAGVYVVDGANADFAPASNGCNIITNGAGVVVINTGPARGDTAGVEQTRRCLDWLDSAFRDAASRGLDMNELLRAPVPDEFRGWAAFATEYTRNVVHLFPRYELISLRDTSTR